MKKVCLVAIAAMFSLSSINAQDIKFGAKAGVNFASISGDETDGFNSRTSLNVGAVVEISISEKFSFQPELLYTGKGASLKDSFDEISIESTIKLDYLSLPLMAKYYVTEGLSLEAGPEVGFLLSAKAKAEGGGESGEIDIKDTFKGIDFGLNFGLGYKLDSGLNFGARYNLGLANIIEESGDFSNQNGVIQLSVGYFFN